MFRETLCVQCRAHSTLSENTILAGTCEHLHEKNGRCNWFPIRVPNEKTLSFYSNPATLALNALLFYTELFTVATLLAANDLSLFSCSVECVTLSMPSRKAVCRTFGVATSVKLMPQLYLADCSYCSHSETALLVSTQNPNSTPFDRRPEVARLGIV